LAVNLRCRNSPISLAICTSGDLLGLTFVYWNCLGFTGWMVCGV